MGKHVLKSTPLTLHHTWESSPDTPFLIFTRRKNVIDVYRERRKENQWKELFSIAPFFSITQLFARLTTPRELTCKSTCFKVNLEARKRVFTYIFIVPLGPRFVLRTSWRPLAAVMLRCKAAADLATSAFGFSALIAAMLVCQSSRTFQPHFSLSASFICILPSALSIAGMPLSRGILHPKFFPWSPGYKAICLQSISFAWCQASVYISSASCLYFAEQADLHRSNIRFRLDQACVFLSNVCKFKTKSVRVLDIFFSPCLQQSSRRSPWLAQSTSFYLLLLSALCFTGSVGEGKKQRLFFHRNSC